MYRIIFFATSCRSTTLSYSDLFGMNENPCIIFQKKKMKPGEVSNNNGRNQVDTPGGVNFYACTFSLHIVCTIIIIIAAIEIIYRQVHKLMQRHRIVCAPSKWNKLCIYLKKKEEKIKDRDDDPAVQFHPQGIINEYIFIHIYFFFNATYYILLYFCGHLP